MTEDNKASKMVEAILDYIYEEGDGKLTNAEILGVIEFVRFQFFENLKKDEE
jgi:altronate dehydratase